MTAAGENAGVICGARLRALLALMGRAMYKCVFVFVFVFVKVF